MCTSLLIHTYEFNCLGYDTLSVISYNKCVFYVQKGATKICFQRWNLKYRFLESSWKREFPERQRKQVCRNSNFMCVCGKWNLTYIAMVNLPHSYFKIMEPMTLKGTEKWYNNIELQDMYFMRVFIQISLALILIQHPCYIVPHNVFSFRAQSFFYMWTLNYCTLNGTNVSQWICEYF
jgi:hypothetical protein